MDAADREEAELLFIAYRKRRKEWMRNRLMEIFLPLVRAIARRLKRKLPDSIDVEDLVQAGTFGLADAIRGFDPDRGYTFATYAGRRIAGAMLDELRGQDWVPRLVRQRAARLNHATERVTTRLGRPPDDDEVAQELGISADAFGRLAAEAQRVELLSLEQSRRWAGDWTPKGSFEGQTLAHLIPAPDNDPTAPGRKLDLLREVAKGCDKAERMILVGYYFEDLTLRQIAASLGLSESRVSQMHSALIERLRSRLERKRASLFKMAAG